MSFFATELAALMQEKKMTAADVARSSKLTEAFLSKLRNGVQTWVSAADMERIAAAFDHKAATHARLLYAHLLDELSGPGKDLISVELRGKPASLSETAPPYLIKLPPKLDADLRLISENIMSDASVRQAIGGLANLIRGRSIGS